MVEDQDINWRVVEQLLLRRGHTVDRAANGEVALATPLADRYAMILMDCQLPGLDGYDVTRSIRSGAASALPRDIPIVAMTAHAMRGDRERCLAAGMDDYLTRPIDPDELDRVLRTSLPQEPPAPGPILDRRRDELTGLFPAQRLAELLAQTLDEIDADVEVLRAADDDSDVRRVVHRIRNGALMIGAAELLFGGDLAPAPETLAARWEAVHGAVRSELFSG